MIDTGPGAALIVNLACTGIVPNKQMTPCVPISLAEITEDVRQAIQQGVQMVHLHARCDQGLHTSEPEPYAQLIRSIRALDGGKDLIICVTTSGRLDSGFAARSKVLDLAGVDKPDMASLTLSSLNFAQAASVNAPDTVRQLAAHMKLRGIKPELEVFDLGMANFVRVLAKEGLISPPYYVNVLLGNVAGAQSTPIELAAILAALPDESIVSIAGLGRFQMQANGLGILYGAGVRIGIEDNIWYDVQRTKLASNSELVKRVVAQAALFERPLMDVREVRKLLQLE